LERRMRREEWQQGREKKMPSNLPICHFLAEKGSILRKSNSEVLAGVNS